MTTTDQYSIIGAGSSFVGVGLALWALLGSGTENDPILLAVATGAAMTATVFLGLTAWKMRQQEMDDDSGDGVV